MKVNNTILAALIIGAGLYASSCIFSGNSNEPKHVSGIPSYHIDPSKIPNDQFGQAVKYGRELMLNTAYYIGPQGVSGRYLGNKMNCTNCHQDAGTKLFSFNLTKSQENYPQYRAREGKVLTLAERVNNCIEHPHNGRPLPLDSKEMVAFLSYLKWINSQSPKGNFEGLKNKEIIFPETAASSKKGEALYAEKCSRCHAPGGEGVMGSDGVTFVYPPVWGANSYQPGSSMHRIVKLAQWLKANMPYDKVAADKPFLTDAEALDIAAFINDDQIHKRPSPKSFEYPYPKEKAIDYDRGPFVDGFTEQQHKYGPYPPIINYWEKKGYKPGF